MTTPWISKSTHEYIRMDDRYVKVYPSGTNNHNHANPNATSRLASQGRAI